MDLGAMATKGYFFILKSSSITPDYLVSYQGHLLGESYPTTEMQLVYCTAPADWAYQNIAKLNINIDKENTNKKLQ